MYSAYEKMASQSVETTIEAPGSGSSKMDDGNQEHTPAKKQKMEDDAFGPDDYFSRLPDLCLLKVFKHVERRDLATMMTVSKRFRPFYYEVSLEKAKWGKGDLIIFQTNRGFAFRFSLNDENYPWKISDEQRQKREHGIPDYSYHYEAFKDERGAHTERRYVNGSLTEDASTQRLHWPIPDELFTALAEILRHHEVEFLCIDKIHFDTPLFFAKLHALLEGHRLWMVVCNDMPCVQITDEIRLAFAHVIKGAEWVKLTTSPEIPSIFNEEVLEVVADSRLRQFSDHPLNFRQAYGHLFSVSFRDSRFFHLLNMSNLEAPAMQLEADSVGLFIHIYLIARDSLGDELGQWIFAVDEHIDADDIAQHMSHLPYEVKEHPDRIEIIRKEDGVTASVLQNEFAVDDNTLFIATVKFRRT